MSDPYKPQVLIIEGTTTDNGSGVSVVLVLEQLERARSGMLQAADALEIILGYTPTTAQMRREWREMKRRGIA